jgi:hypothetical protein
MSSIASDPHLAELDGFRVNINAARERGVHDRHFELSRDPAAVSVVLYLSCRSC